MGHTILVIDDEPATFTIAKAMLEQDGYTVDYCASGADALVCLESGTFRPDLIFCDATMAPLSGEETVRRMRTNELFHGPVLMLSGKPPEEFNGLQGLIQGVVTKPIPVTQLGSLIRKHVGER